MTGRKNFPFAGSFSKCLQCWGWATQKTKPGTRNFTKVSKAQVLGPAFSAFPGRELAVRTPTGTLKQDVRVTKGSLNLLYPDNRHFVTTFKNVAIPSLYVKNKSWKYLYLQRLIYRQNKNNLANDMHICIHNWHTITCMFIISMKHWLQLCQGDDICLHQEKYFLCLQQNCGTDQSISRCSVDMWMSPNIPRRLFLWTVLGNTDSYFLA